MVLPGLYSLEYDGVPDALVWIGGYFVSGFGLNPFHTDWAVQQE
jgi:hypothetical protein